MYENGDSCPSTEQFLKGVLTRMNFLICHDRMTKGEHRLWCRLILQSDQSADVQKFLPDLQDVFSEHEKRYEFSVPAGALLGSEIFIADRTAVSGSRSSL